MIKLGITIGILTSAVLLWLLFYPNVYGFLGYYVTTDQNALAQYLVDQNLPPSDCHKLMHFEKGAAPTVSEKRLDCIIQYAVISKNP